MIKKRGRSVLADTGAFLSPSSEGRLYAALTHLDHHVKPTIKEWDHVVDRMPND